MIYFEGSPLYITSTFVVIIIIINATSTIVTISLVHSYISCSNITKNITLQVVHGSDGNVVLDIVNMAFSDENRISDPGFMDHL